MGFKSIVNKLINVNGTIQVNGKTISGDYVGGSISVSSKGVFINNKLVEGTNSRKTIEINIVGNVQTIEGDSTDITVEGNVESIRTSTGDIQVMKSVKGNITARTGDISVGGDCLGSITLSTGDIDITGKVEGNVKTSVGDISFKR